MEKSICFFFCIKPGAGNIHNRSGSWYNSIKRLHTPADVSQRAAICICFN